MSLKALVLNLRRLVRSIPFFFLFFFFDQLMMIALQTPVASVAFLRACILSWALLRSHVGFEYFAQPSSPQDGFITWQMGGQPTVRMGATSVGPDPDGSGVGQRLIPEEPMVRCYARSRERLHHRAFLI